MIEKVEQIVAEHFGISAAQMLEGKSRPENDARHILWYFLHCILGFSAGAIAARYGVSTRNVIFYSSLIRDGVGREPFYSKNCREIQTRLRSVDII